MRNLLRLNTIISTLHIGLDNFRTKWTMTQISGSVRSAR